MPMTDRPSHRPRVASLTEPWTEDNKYGGKANATMRWADTHGDEVVGHVHVDGGDSGVEAGHIVSHLSQADAGLSGPLDGHVTVDRERRGLPSPKETQRDTKMSHDVCNTEHRTGAAVGAS